VDVSSLANHIARDQHEEQRAREAQQRRESSSKQHRGHRKGGSSSSSSSTHSGDNGSSGRISNSGSGGGATIALTKLVLGLGLYPNIALRCPHNVGRPLAEHQFLTRQRGGLFMQPNCALSAANLDAASSSAGGTSGGHSAREGRQREQNEVLVFSHLIETHKPFLSSVLACPAPAFLLLACQTIDTDATGTRLLFDHWLMVRCLGEFFFLQKFECLSSGFRYTLSKHLASHCRMRKLLFTGVFFSFFCKRVPAPVANRWRCVMVLLPPTVWRKQ